MEHVLAQIYTPESGTDSNNVIMNDGGTCPRIVSKTRNASATPLKSSVLRRNRPLLPVQRIQSLLQRHLHLPPMTSTVRSVRQS